MKTLEFHRTVGFRTAAGSRSEGSQWAIWPIPERRWGQSRGCALKQSTKLLKFEIRYFVSFFGTEGSSLARLLPKFLNYQSG